MAQWTKGFTLLRKLGSAFPFLKKLTVWRHLVWFAIFLCMIPLEPKYLLCCVCDSNVVRNILATDQYDLAISTIQYERPPTAQALRHFSICEEVAQALVMTTQTQW